MRVIIDAISTDSGGGRRYFNGLLPALISSRKEWNFVILVKKGVSNGDSRNRNVAWIELPRMLCKFPLRLITQQCAVPIVGRIARAQVVLSLSDVGPIWSPVPVLATVANAFIYRASSRCTGYRLSKADLPFLHRIRTRALALLSKLFLRSAKGLIFWTAASRAEVESLTGKELPSMVIHNGEPFDSTESGEAYRLRKKNIVCVSTIVRYRNQLRLVRAFHELLKSDTRCKEFSLLLIGSVCDGPYASSLRRFVAENKLEEYVHILGDIQYDRVEAYYAESWGLVFPSRVETYGFPVVEALFKDLPMAVSDIPAFRELAGSAAIYFDPTDVESIKDGLKRLLWDDTLRERLVEAGKRQCLRYSWKTAALQTARMIESALNLDGSERAREENEGQCPETRWENR